MNPPDNTPIDEALKAEVIRFANPENRIAFLKEHGVEHHFLVARSELAAIQQGTGQLNAQIRNWRVLSQALFGVSSPEEALEFAKAQKKHREGIMNDRMRYRNALLEVMKRIKADNPEAWQIAFNAINP